MDPNANKSRRLKIILSLLVMLGTFLYLIPALIITISPESLERAAFGFLKIRLQEEIVQKIDALCATTEQDLRAMEENAAELNRLAEKFEEAKQQEQQKGKDGDRSTREEAYDTMSSILSSIASASENHSATVRAIQEDALCLKLRTEVIKAIDTASVPDNIAESVMENMRFEEDSLLMLWVKPRLSDLEERLREAWDNITANLLHEIRLFLWINAGAYLLIAFCTMIWPRYTREFFLPAMLLILASLITTIIYVFGQNWFYTIIYQQYWGWYTAAVLGGVFLSLCDITFNDARITKVILRIILEFWQAILSAFT